MDTTFRKCLGFIHIQAKKWIYLENFIKAGSWRNIVQRDSLEVPGKVDSKEEQTHALANTPLQWVGIETRNLLFDAAHSHDSKGKLFCKILWVSVQYKCIIIFSDISTLLVSRNNETRQITSHFRHWNRRHCFGSSSPSLSSSRWSWSSSSSRPGPAVCSGRHCSWWPRPTMIRWYSSS